MRPTKLNARRRSEWRTILFIVLAITVGGAGTVAVLAWFNIVDPARLAFWQKPYEAPPVPADWVKVYVSAKAIPAHTAITDDYLVNPKTGKWVTLLVPPKLVSNGAIDDIHKIRGRVTARDIGAGKAFQETDFLPRGTRPGIAAGIPRGKRAITLDASKIRGAHDVREGDQVDLLASIPVDMPGANHSGGRSGGNVLTSPDTALLPKRSIVRPLVQDGVVVVPVRIRAVPTTSNSLMQGATTRTMPVQEVVLAIDPQEVAPLAEAIDLKYEITCVARSGLPTPVVQSPASTAQPRPAPGVQTDRPGASSPGRPAQPTESVHDAVHHSGSNAKSGSAVPGAKPDITPGFDPMGHIRFMEVMVGDKRQFVVFNGPGNSPVVAGQSDEAVKPAAGVPQAGAVEEKKE